MHCKRNIHEVLSPIYMDTQLYCSTEPYIWLWDNSKMITLLIQWIVILYYHLGSYLILVGDRFSPSYPCMSGGYIYYIYIVTHAWTHMHVWIILLEGSGKYNKGLLIEASDDIVVYAMNKIRFSSESYLAIPVDVTGYDYFTISTEVTDGSKCVMCVMYCLISYHQLSTLFSFTITRCFQYIWL